ncbi:MAG: hypothetical protein HRT37_24540 [Alteromonadaceae bacterium]|nr:hypothetical protein [Alteromonadaceae bacterium]
MLYIKINRQNLLFAILLTLLCGCQLTQVATYDPQIRNLLVRSSVEVERFWQDMMLVPGEERQYKHFLKQYKGIEFELAVLLKLNQMRPLNDESTTQAQILLELWQEYMSTHTRTNKFKDFLIKQRITQYQRVFNALLVAEEAKDI